MRFFLSSTLVLALVAGLATAAQAKGKAAAPAQGHHAAHRSQGSHAASAGGGHGGGGRASGGGLAAVPTDVATPLAGTWVHDERGGSRAAKSGAAADGFDLGGTAGRAKGSRVGSSGDLGYTTRLSSGSGRSR